MNPAQVLPDDPALPQLAQALDERAMAGVFAAALDAHGLAVERCVVERVKYRPHRNCTLAYRLRLRGMSPDHVFEQRVAARLCSGGESLRRTDGAMRAAFRPSPAGPAWLHLPGLDMLTWWWPNDAKLGAPAVLADARVLREQVLPELVHAMSEGRGQLVAHQVEIVQAVPEQRLCARVDLEWCEGARRVFRSAYAKSSREPGGGTVHAVLRALEQSAAWRAGRLRTPRAMLWQPAFDLHWQEALSGRALLDLPGADAGRVAAALGAQLAALHGTAVAQAPALTVPELQARLAQVVEVLGLALPASRATLQTAAGRLREGLAALDDESASTLHGDLHPRNVLVDGEQLALIDLDGLRRGPALLELGSWMAEGIYRARLEGGPARRDGAAWESLLRGYAGAGGRTPSEPALAWATAWNLLCERAWRCVVNLKPGRFAIAPGLVALAAEMADTRCTEVW